MARWRAPRFLAWLAIPFAASLALALGHVWMRPTLEIEANQFDEILELAPIQAPRQLTLELLKADGRPAQGAVAILLEPEFAVAYANQSGVAVLNHFQGGPARIQAYMPGHDLLSAGPLPLDQWSSLQFTAREEPSIARLQPEELLRHDLILRDRNGQALTQVQVIATAPSKEATFPPRLQAGVEPSRYMVPWIAFSDEDGWARLDGVPRISLQARAYPLGFPLDEAWLLGEMELVPTVDGESAWIINPSQLRITGLPSELAFSLERLDTPGKLPLRRIPSSGVLTWPTLPPGSYRASIDGEFRDYTLRSGENEFSWGSL